MKQLVVCAACAAIFAAAACGDNKPTLAADGPGPTADAPNTGGSDGGTTPQTLTAFVIDLVMHHTTATDLPQPYSAFATLPDPDGSNTSAYSSLF